MATASPTTAPTRLDRLPVNSNTPNPDIQGTDINVLLSQRIPLLRTIKNAQMIKLIGNKSFLLAITTVKTLEIVRKHLACQINFQLTRVPRTRIQGALDHIVISLGMVYNNTIECY